MLVICTEKLSFYSGHNAVSCADQGVVKGNPMFETLRQHWPEYLIEAVPLASFMVSACGFGVLLEHPASPVRQAIPHDDARRVLMGLALVLTAVGLVYSAWGKGSGAHINPSVTLTFWRLGKVKMTDALFYFFAQFIVLRASNHQRLARYTGLCAVALVMIYISLAAPLSGMSMNRRAHSVPT